MYSILLCIVIVVIVVIGAKISNDLKFPFSDGLGLLIVILGLSLIPISLIYNQTETNPEKIFVSQVIVNEPIKAFVSSNTLITDDNKQYRFYDIYIKDFITMALDLDDDNYYYVEYKEKRNTIFGKGAFGNSKREILNEQEYNDFLLRLEK